MVVGLRKSEDDESWANFPVLALRSLYNGVTPELIATIDLSCGGYLREMCKINGCQLKDRS